MNFSTLTGLVLAGISLTGCYTAPVAVQSSVSAGEHTAYYRQQQQRPIYQQPIRPEPIRPAYQQHLAADSRSCPRQAIPRNFLYTNTLKKGSWQNAHCGGVVAHCDGTMDGSRILRKCKLDVIVKGMAYTIDHKRNVQISPQWDGQSLPVLVNFNQVFPRYTFGQVYIPAGEPSGNFGELAVAPVTGRSGGNNYSAPQQINYRQNSTSGSIRVTQTTTRTSQNGAGRWSPVQ